MDEGRNTTISEDIQNAFRTAPVNSVLVVINVLIFFVIGHDTDPVFSRFALTQDAFFQKEWYRLVTSLFLHDGFEHILSNMFMLIYVGTLVEKSLGHLWYFLAYLACGIGGNLASLYYEYNHGLYWRSVGASGAIFGIIGIMAVLLIYGRGGQGSKRALVTRLLVGIGFSVYAGFQNAQTNNAAHIGGLCAGIIFGILFSFIRNKRRKEKDS